MINVIWQPDWEESLGENGYMYMYGCPFTETMTKLSVSNIPIQNKKFLKDKRASTTILTEDDPKD